MVKHSIAALAMIGAVGSAHAGFVTGVIVGSAMSGGGSTNIETPLHVASDKHDVISCVQVTYKHMCRVPSYLKPVDSKGVEKVWSDEVTPEQYAGNNGYRVIHRVSVGVLPGRDSHIFMEVSR